MKSPVPAIRFATAVVAIGAIAAPGAALAAKWERVGSAGPVAVWVDKDSIQRSGNQARAWIEWRWAQPTELRDANPPRTYRLERQLQIANCADRSYAVLEGTHYADERGTDAVSSYKYGEATLPFNVAPKQTIREQVVVAVCNAPPPAKKP